MSAPRSAPAIPHTLSKIAFVRSLSPVWARALNRRPLPSPTVPRAPHLHPAIFSPPAVHGVHVRPSGASPSPAPPSTTTVVAAVGAQARVVPRVRVAQSLDAINAPGPVPVVYFDNVPDGAALSLTAISLGAGAYLFYSCAPKHRAF